MLIIRRPPILFRWLGISPKTEHTSGRRKRGFLIANSSVGLAKILLIDNLKWSKCNCQVLTKVIGSQYWFWNKTLFWKSHICQQKVHFWRKKLRFISRRDWSHLSTSFPDNPGKTGLLKARFQVSWKNGQSNKMRSKDSSQLIQKKQKSETKILRWFRFLRVGSLSRIAL